MDASDYYQALKKPVSRVFTSIVIVKNTQLFLCCTTGLQHEVRSIQFLPFN